MLSWGSDVYGAELTGSALAIRYQPVVAGGPAFISFEALDRLAVDADL